MLDYRPRHTGWTSWLRKHRRLLGEVEGAIRERGPLSNADFACGRSPDRARMVELETRHPRAPPAVDERAAADPLAPPLPEALRPRRAGRPGYRALETPGSEEFLRWHFERSLHAMGAATELDLRMYLTFPRLEAAVRRRAFRAMVDRGEVVEVAVEGHRAKWFARASDLPDARARGARARSVARHHAARAIRFLPLAPASGHAQLFGFDYRIEVYTPGHRRVHGYYTLPLFHDGQLIGRVDAKNHREERRLECAARPLRGLARARRRATRGLVGTRSTAIARSRAWPRSVRSLADVHRRHARVEVARVTPRRLASAVRSALRPRRDRRDLRRGSRRRPDGA